MAIVEPLRIDFEHEGAGTVRLVLRGDLDLASAPLFGQLLAAACEAKPSEILIDFTELSFCDSSGIRACILGAEQCTASGTRMTILGASENVRRVFEVVGLDDHFAWADA